jgi:hypothetical protein
MADAMTTEAYALRERILIAQHIRCNKFTIQSDNLEIMEAMKDGGFTATAVASILYD